MATENQYNENHILTLIEAHYRHTLTPEQAIELAEFTETHSTDEIAQLVIGQLERLPQIEYKGAEWDGMLHTVLSQELEHQSASFTEAPVHRMYFLRKGLQRFVAAAVLIVIAGVAGLLYYNNRTSTVPVTAQTQTQRFKNEIFPVRGGAILKTSDGKIINLDTANNGTILAGIDKNGQSLSVSGATVSAITYATLTTQKGNTQTLVLPDGSKVWLDAQSSVSFPNRFTGKNREISITGRVFIEAFHDPAHPLITHTKDKDVTVWGTQFNIDAYGPVTTTLVEGKVQVGQAILKPGEQYRSGKVSQVEDMDRITAWKENNFKFEFTPIREVTAELSRWYDMDIEYHDSVDDGYRFTITRNVPLTDILKAMEINGLVKFTIEGKKVTVYKAK